MIRKYVFACLTIVVVSCSSIQNKKPQQYLRYVQGYTHFRSNDPFAIYSLPNDAFFERMVDLEYEQEAGYMVTIIERAKGFFYVRFDYPDIGTAWMRKGEIGLNIRGLESYEDRDSVPIRRRPRSRSRIIGTLTKPQHVQILDVSKSWAYVEAIGSNGESIRGWLAPIYQCGNPYTTCP